VTSEGHELGEFCRRVCRSCRRPLDASRCCRHSLSTRIVFVFLLVRSFLSSVLLVSVAVAVGDRLLV